MEKPGEEEKRTSMDTISQIEKITGMKFKDAAQMQLAVERQQREQLEIQRNLQWRIEERAKRLKEVFDQQQIAKNFQNLDIVSSHQSPNPNYGDDDILKMAEDTLSRPI